MRQSTMLSIGMDVHKDSSAVAYIAPAHGAEVTALGTIGTRPCDIDHLIRTRQSKAQPRALVSDAGPWGAWRSRSVTQQGYEGRVVAPAWLPKKAGDCGQPARREALPLARRRRAGDLTPVSVPQVDDEAIGDLTRAREATSGALTAAQVRRNAFRLRHASRDTGRATWGPAPLRWLSAVVGATPAQPSVFQDYSRAVKEPTARLQRLEHELHAPANAWRVNPVVAALQALRGGQLTVAVTLGAALGALSRFAPPRDLMKGLGRVPAASSTGERRRQGCSPKAGTSHARRGLVEGAGASR
jgi:transposase